MSKVFKAEQIREIDAYTIKHEPINSINLMERASKGLFEWIRNILTKDTPIVFIIGPGNNGGDGWALARMLFHFGFENLRLYVLTISDTISADSAINKQRLIDETDIRVNSINSKKDFPYISNEEWVIDAMFGSGLSRPLSGLARELVEYLNNSDTSGVLSIDIPSGLFADDNTDNPSEGIIKATHTLSFEFPKLSFFFAENDQFLGKWNILPINLHPDKITSEPSNYQYIHLSDIKQRLKPRTKFSHKGTFGHALIIAGSYGMMGAAVLTTRAAVKSGAGLVTSHIPAKAYDIIQISVPEALVSIDDSDLIFTGIKNINTYNAIALGPGINKKTNTMRAVSNLLDLVDVPLVIDADGLNILSENKELLNKLPEDCILTPHPKEFDRLTHDHDSHFQRFTAQQSFSIKHKVYVVLKGAHTSISSPNGMVWFNSTGNPGMAKGGSGDILTGIIVALLAQGYNPADAALIGVYIHGLAADIAVEQLGYHATSPTDILNNLGFAFKKIEQ